MKVLILNHGYLQCGTYQYAKRIHSIVSKSKDIEYIHKKARDKQGYLEVLAEVKPDYVVYNYHIDRMPWLTVNDINSNKSVKHFFLFHDGSILNSYDKYIFCGEIPNYNNPIPKAKSVLLTRPIMEYGGTYPVNELPTIGSFGFATDHKGFPELVSLVQKTFKEAVINLHLTSPYFGVTAGYNLPDIIRKCQASNTNPKIKLNISSDFVDDEKLLTFLAGNDINVFNYKVLRQPNPGISSAIDYALSVRRPFAVTKNSLFRHVLSDDISLEKRPIKQVLDA